MGPHRGEGAHVGTRQEVALEARIVEPGVGWGNAGIDLVAEIHGLLSSSVAWELCDFGKDAGPLCFFICTMEMRTLIMATDCLKACPLGLLLILFQSYAGGKRSPIPISQSEIRRLRVVLKVFWGDGNTRAWGEAQSQLDRPSQCY